MLPLPSQSPPPGQDHMVTAIWTGMDSARPSSGAWSDGGGKGEGKGSLLPSCHLHFLKAHFTVPPPSLFHLFTITQEAERVSIFFPFALKGNPMMDSWNCPLHILKRRQSNLNRPSWGDKLGLAIHSYFLLLTSAILLHSF